MKLRKLWPLVALCSVVAAPAMPCGPFLPNQLLIAASSAILALPPGDFAVELAGITPTPAKRWPTVAIDKELPDMTADAELADLGSVLPGDPLGMAKSGAELLMNVRAAPAAEREAMVSKLPVQFRLYALGAAAYQQADPAGAVKYWRQLLDLPAGDRKLRSTWAAFMLGKAAMATDPAGARKQFQAVRALAAAGFADRLGLAATSIGWEAQTYLNSPNAADWVRALEMYVEQAGHRDPTAETSVLLAGRKVMNDPAAAQLAAKSPLARRVLTGWLLARDNESSWPDENRPKHRLSRQWLAALRAAAVRDAEGADRLAWLAYRAGQFEEAAHWAQVAPPKAAFALWTRAKIELKAGHVATGVQLLRQAIAVLPDAKWQTAGWDDDAYLAEDEEGATLQARQKAQAELGLVSLAQGDYREALDQLVAAGYRIDAAWVAERVLTAAELQKWVDQHKGEKAIAYVLARKLVREGKLAAARPYMDKAEQGHLAELERKLADGRDTAKPARIRALAWWRAAQITRANGMELQGFEAEPDWTALGGSYEMKSIDHARTAERGIGAATADELRRVQASTAQPDERFHYRAIAAERALTASELLPDGDAQGGAILCNGARWVVNRPALHKYYKIALKRFPKVVSGFGQECPPAP